MKWTKEQIKEHIKAAEILEKIVKTAFDYIKKNSKAHEYDVQQFILKQFKKHKVKTDRPPIVAFRNNTQYVHYYPSQYSRKIKPESLIMIDLWGRINKKGAPFADITLMGYYGKKISAEVLKVFNVIKQARNKAVHYLKKCLKKGKMPTGFQVDMIARDYIKKAGYGDNFLHGLGHPLGFTAPHGAGVRLSPKFKKPLKKMIGYTIEPGVYLNSLNNKIKNICVNQLINQRKSAQCARINADKTADIRRKMIFGNFGIRSEIDFYIDENNRVIVTTKVQREIFKI